MKHWSVGNFPGKRWLSSTLLFCCLNIVGAEIGRSAPAIADLTAPKQTATSTDNNGVTPDSPPNTGKAAPGGSENATVASPTPTAPPQSAPLRSPIDIAAILNPALKNPLLPPIGDAAVYLPSDADALGLHLVVRLSDRRVYLYKGDQRIASYPIAIGKPGWETPVGTYKVLSMEKNPIFKSFKSGRTINPGPDNPLGVRWIGIWTDGKTQLGFHGTNQPELIGQAVSHGCIRMYNKDVVALYEQVALGVTVTVKP